MPVEQVYCPKGQILLMTRFLQALRSMHEPQLHPQIIAFCHDHKQKECAAVYVVSCCLAGGPLPKDVATALENATAVHEATKAALWADRHAAIETMPSVQDFPPAAQETISSISSHESSSNTSAVLTECGHPIVMATAGRPADMDARTGVVAAMQGQDLWAKTSSSPCQSSANAAAIMPSQSIPELAETTSMSKHASIHQNSEEQLAKEQNVEAQAAEEQKAEEQSAEDQNAEANRAEEQIVEKQGAEAHSAEEEGAEEQAAEGQSAKGGTAIKQSPNKVDYTQSNRFKAVAPVQQPKGSAVGNATDLDKMFELQVQHIKASAVMLPEPAEVLVTDLLDYRCCAVLCCAVLCCAVLCCAAVLDAE